MEHPSRFVSVSVKNAMHELQSRRYRSPTIGNKVSIRSSTNQDIDRRLSATKYQSPTIVYPIITWINQHRQSTTNMVGNHVDGRLPALVDPCWPLSSSSWSAGGWWGSGGGGASSSSSWTGGSWSGGSWTGGTGWRKWPSHNQITHGCCPCCRLHALRRYWIVTIQNRDPENNKTKGMLQFFESILN